MNPRTPAEYIRAVSAILYPKIELRPDDVVRTLEGWASDRERVAREFLVRSAVDACPPGTLKVAQLQAYTAEAFKVGEAYVAEAIRLRWEDLVLAGLTKKAGQP